MFVSKKKNFRRRVGEDESDGAEATTEVAVANKATPSGKAPSTSPAGSAGSTGAKKDRAKDKAKVPSGPSRLSFGGDEDEGEETMVATLKPKKKPVGVGHGHGHRLGRGGNAAVKDVVPLPPPAASNLQSGAGEYTKERLAELAKNTKNLGGQKKLLAEKKAQAEKKALAEKKASEPLGEPIVVLKGLLKPAGSAPFGLSAAGSIGAGAPALASQRDPQTEVESRLGLMGIGLGAEPSGITHIPDAAAISAAKAKRERLRQAQVAPDYIPLAGSGDVGKPDRSKYRESGLVREQEDDIEGNDKGGSSGEDDEMDGRMVFVGDGTKAKRRGERGGRRVGAGLGKEASSEPGSRGESGLGTGPAEDVARPNSTLPGVSAKETNAEEDEEALRWEEEQLRKGVGKRAEETIQATGRSAAGGRPGLNAAMVPGGSLPPAGWGFGARKVEAQSAAEQGEAVMRALRDGLTRMREAHARSQQQMQQAEDSLAHTAENVLSLEAALREAGAKYRFVQELRDYVANLCDFLRDKAPLIEELEEHVQQLQEDRAAAMAERRALDNADEMAEAEAAMSAAMAAMGRGAGTVSATQAATAAAAAVRDGTSVAAQVDEFGRDVNLQKRIEATRRQQAREWRQLRRAAKRAEEGGKSGANGKAPHGAPGALEGESSSEESESEETAFRSGMQEVLAAAGTIFKDAAEEYSQLSHVKEKLEGWKAKYPTTYRDAYVALSAPSLFAPFVRLELLEWNPLHGTAGFDSMNWYNLLFDYGMPAGGSGEVDPDDLDANLIPKLVEKVALPILRQRVAKCWDPASWHGSTRAVAALQELLIYVPAESEPLQEMLTAVRTRMAEAVAGAKVPAWTPAVLAAVPAAGKLAAQRFASAVRLLRNLATWRDVIARPILDQLALEELVLNRILPHLRAVVPTLHDAVLRTERLVTALGAGWLGTGSGSAPVSTKLEPLVTYLGVLTRSLESRRDAGATMDEVSGLARRIKRMLVDLNEYDRARAVAKTFQLREAI